METTGSITAWLNQLQQGDQQAVQRLWEEYFQKMVRLARRKLQPLPQQLADEESLAASAFNSFCLAADKKRFPKLHDRDDLWQVLVMLVRNKAADRKEYHTRDKRNYLRIQKPGGDDSSDANLFYQMIQSGEPDPQFAAEVAEECGILLAKLPDEELRQIALWKMEGYTNEEIAKKIGCAPATVERRLKNIRKYWSRGE